MLGERLHKGTISHHMKITSYLTYTILLTISIFTEHLVLSASPLRLRYISHETPVKLVQYTCIVSCVLLLSTIVANADSGGYVFIPADSLEQMDHGNLTVYRGGSTGSVSFMELPLWIKCLALLDALLVLLTLYYAIPFISGHIKDLMGNKNRKAILNYIESNPGCTSAEVSRNTKINIGTIRYHLYKLEAEGKIIVGKIGKYARIFRDSSRYGDKERIIASHLKNDTMKAILKYIIEHPGVTNQVLAERLHMDKSSAHRYINRLVSDNIIIFEQDGKNKRYYLHNDAVKAFTRLMSGYPRKPG